MSYTREQTWALLCEHTQSESLRKHALSVEAAMRHYALHFGEDVERWGRVGLIHDFDYEKHPTAQEHPYVGVDILRGLGWDESDLRCILGHAHYTGVPRDTLMARSLFGVDELCGLITAVALVRPSRKLADVEVSSVQKKMKQKAFAAQVSREDIEQGAGELGVDLTDHISHVLVALQGVSDSLGL
jgi:predicted hydrolase (HD superfamily)